MIYILFDRGTTNMCEVIYSDSMCAPLVTQHTSILQFTSCHANSSMSAVTEAAATRKCYFNLLINSGKGGTYTTSPATLCPHKKKSYGVRYRDLEVHFVKGKSACLAWTIQQFGRCSLRLYKNGQVPPIARRNFHSSCTYPQVYIVVLSNSHSKIYISKGLYFFGKDPVYFTIWLKTCLKDTQYSTMFLY
jgi:hypothetical protein